ncbi:STAS domain-containing protein [Sphingomonas sp. PR090111-T3T-6A]|uniref:STAS domain-containing protein n=1 Tax=Sphingomonas sp. PR090111-T3T-6A TaxID=685778 RepID=UPI00035DAF6E|nr:STAS domain-containing protein [Sphingomonas sp. PR090111-T3T-6A]
MQPLETPPATAPAAGRTVTLPAHAVTTTAEDLRVRLVLACDVAGGIEIDAGEVESIGQAVLQLLVAAKDEAEAKGLPFSIPSSSPAFAERVKACRLAPRIGLTDEEEPVQ